MSTKLPLKQLLVERGIARTLDEAERIILASEITVDEPKIQAKDLKPGLLVSESARISVKPKDKFVSRGGLKLEHALKTFEIDVNGRVCCDIGTSTGGFVDCLLHYGARKVYAVDTGYGKIHYALRNDPRVILFEKTNFRYFDFELFDEPVSLFTVDVSFISAIKILERIKLYSSHIKQVLHTIVLIKPQFEAKPYQLKKGILDEQFHSELLYEIETNIKKLGFQIISQTPAPIKGRQGNQEYLYYLKCGSF